MKTPREILLQHHQAITPKLDEIRRAAVANLKECPAAREQSLTVAVALKIWRELIWPARRIWAGFAVVWLVIIAVNLEDSDVSSIAEAKTKSSPGILMAWEQQQKFLAEFIGPAEAHEAAKPKPPPRPRSQRQPPWQLG